MARKTIVALYDRRTEAEAVRQELLDAGFDDLTVDVVFDGGFGGANDGHGGLYSLLIGWGVPDEEAHVYAEAVRTGGALVAVSLTRVEAVNRALAILDPDGARSAPLGQAAAAMRGVNAAPVAASSGRVSDEEAVPAEPMRTDSTIRAGVYPAPDSTPDPMAGQGRTRR